MSGCAKLKNFQKTRFSKHCHFPIPFRPLACRRWTKKLLIVFEPILESFSLREGFPVTLLKPRRFGHFILSLFMLVAFHAVAGETPPQPPLALTAENLATVIDPLFAKWIDEGKGVGAVVAVTTREGLLFAKGYGRADIGSGAPFTADATLVRPGSISKLFTGVAVMQLVDQGKLDLDRDVNDYLDFKIPIPDGGVPVTLRRLLTHRAGFEEHGKGLFSRNPEPEPLAHWVERSPPLRIFPAGDVPAYSNYGFALAGYIVERVSGEPFAAYMARHVLQPLGMTNSTFEQPLPGALAPLMAKGYRTAQKPLGFFETIAAAPAGSLSAPGTDMARFMRALLNGGALDGAQILSKARLDQMTSPQEQTAAGFMGLAFVGTALRHYDSIGHGGATMAFLSDLTLFPAQGFGVFVSFDGMQAARSAPQLANIIVEKFLPPIADSSPAGEPTPADSKIAGVYHSSRRAESSFMKIGDFLSQLRVTVDKKGQANVSSAIWPFGEGVAVRRVGANLYEGPKNMRMAFEDGKGAEARFVAPAVQFQHAPGYEDARLVGPALVASALILFLTLLAWPIAAFRRRRRKIIFGQDRFDRGLYATVRVVALVDVVVIAASIAFFFLFKDFTNLNGSLDALLLMVYGLAWTGVFGAAVTLWIAISFWRRRVGGGWTRAHHSLVALSAAFIAWFFVTFHIAGTTLNY
jgi:CubicO group peptidase (beta-lactamase class C family)